MEKKRKQTRTGIVALVLGVGPLAGAAYNFQRGGAVLIAVCLSLFAAALLAVGVIKLNTASRMR